MTAVFPGRPRTVFRPSGLPLQRPQQNTGPYGEVLAAGVSAALQQLSY
ncbi:hypothetical protein [Streptomyces sp. NPDC052036]